MILNQNRIAVEIENQENKLIQIPIISLRISFTFQFQNTLNPLREYIYFLSFWIHLKKKIISIHCLSCCLLCMYDVGCNLIFLSKFQFSILLWVGIIAIISLSVLCMLHFGHSTLWLWYFPFVSVSKISKMRNNFRNETDFEWMKKKLREITAKFNNKYFSIFSANSFFPFSTRTISDSLLLTMNCEMNTTKKKKNGTENNKLAQDNETKQHFSLLFYYFIRLTNSIIKWISIVIAYL